MFNKKNVFISSFLILFLVSFILLITYIDKSVDKRSHREKSYDKLLTASHHIENIYVKDIIDDTTSKILESNKKEKVRIAVQKDFYSLARKKEYDEVIKIIKSSGFKIEPEVKDCVPVLFSKDECHLTNQIEVW
ncbi:MAG: hypothetical protein J6W29_04925 [Neisseriaceae bacterium]|nr:hypothetical protein [Neisseriaceae bacterium]